MANDKQTKPSSSSAAGGASTEAAPRTAKDKAKDSLRTQPYEAQQAALAGGVPEGGVPEAAAPEEDKGAQANLEQELKAQYTQQFGSTLGPKLYDAVTKALGADALLKYARSGLKSALDKVPNLAQDDAAKKQLQEVWPQAAQQITDGLLGGEVAQKVAAAISEVLREHPKTLIGAALLAAVLVAMKCYADNIDIPALEGMVDLGKHLKVGGKVDLGHIKDITVDSLHAYLQVHTSKFEMKIDVGHEREAAQLNAKFDGSAILFENSGKELDPQTQQLTREYSSKLSSTFGSAFVYDEKTWNMESMKLALGLALEVRDKRILSTEKIGELERSPYKETVFKLYGNYLQQFKNVDGGLQPEQTNMALGLSLVMKSGVAIKTVGPDGKEKNYDLNPTSVGFNWGLNYKDSPMGGNPSRSIGMDAGVSVQKGNWSLGVSADYTHDLMRNTDSVGGKITFSLKF